MKYFKTKYEKKSARITFLIAVILVLLIFIVGPKYMDPPLEYGIAINFGDSNFGSGRVQPKKPTKSQAQEEINEPQKVEESKLEKSVPQEIKEEKVFTQDNAESIAIKKREAQKAKEKTEAEAERIAREKQIQEEKKKKLDALIGGIGKSDDIDTRGKGDDNRAGDKGQLNGNPYAPSYFGQSGSGGGGVGYGLRGRGKPTKTKILPKCDEEGKVVVKIYVNRQGKVFEAFAGEKGTTGALCLYDAAKKTALTYRWPTNSKAPLKQVGFVVINFSLSQ